MTATYNCLPQDDFDIQGTIPPGVIAGHGPSARAEEREPLPGVLLYHYFEGDRALVGEEGTTLLARILETRRIGSRVRCFTREQILASLGTASPHYGDGAYATARDALREAPAEVQRAHGLSSATMAYRAVLLVHDRVRLRKFHQTAGVTRSWPRGTLRMDDLEFFDPADVEMLYVQRWDGASWETIA